MGFLFIANSRIDQVKCPVGIDRYSTAFHKQFVLRLREAGIYHRLQIRHKVLFRGAPFRFASGGFDSFNGISNGEIEFIEKDSKVFIKTRIFFVEYFIIALLFCIIPALALMPDMQYRVVAFLAIWLLYIIATSYTIYCFNSYVAKTLSEVLNSF